MLLETRWCWWGQTRLDSSSERDKSQVTEWGDAATSWHQEQQVCVGAGGGEEGFTKLALYREFSSVQSYLTLCDPMDCSTPGLPVHHQLPEFTQTHVHQVGDAIQQSYPLSSPSPPALNISQHQGLFKWVKLFASGGQSIGASASASFLPMNIQDWSPLGCTGRIILNTRGDFPKPDVW